jgi:3-deoxy-D-manno-octulosonic-acid transferase
MTAWRNLLKGSYRRFQMQVVHQWILPRVFTSARVEQSARQMDTLFTDPGVGEFKGASILERVWFHAASVGELETLAPIIFSLVQRGSESQRPQVIVTILSESAEGALRHLVQDVKDPKSIIFAGYSPWEGQWKRVFEWLKPTLFVTAKYEAWPDLWVSLQELNIPLGIVSARDRKSLRIARKMCQWMNGKIPKLILFPVNEADQVNLNAIFPEAQTHVVGEPRWERVFARAQQGVSRVASLVTAAQLLPRPWAVLGSVWMEDLKFLVPNLREMQGTLWIVPHQIDDSNLQEIESFLSQHSLSAVRTRGTDVLPEGIRCVLVNEMGFLSELYSVAEWVWVGGGFGDGIHSTIEPAFRGVPIGGGAQGSDRFSEISELTQTGQFTLVRNRAELQIWLQRVESQIKDHGLREHWVEQAHKRLGATQKILEALEKFQWSW